MTPTVSGVPNTEGTPRRSVRVGDPLWKDFKEAADYNGETAAQVIVEAIEDYVRRTKRQRERREARERDED